MSKWIGVDLDGTLAHYDEWRGEDHIGDPVEEMVRRVRGWLEEGKDVRIMTARVSDESLAQRATRLIEKWCEKHLGVVLPVTCRKDFEMVELWDDRVVTVEKNTGRVLTRESVDPSDLRVVSVRSI